MPDFVRQVPVAKALDGDTVLAFEMNGQALPPANRFPLRVIVPGWEAAYSIKWLTSVEVSTNRGRMASGFRRPTDIRARVSRRVRQSTRRTCCRWLGWW